MNKVRNFLEGKKSYITAVVIFVVGGLKALGYDVPEGVIEMLFAVLGITIRLGISKVE